jgi:hypothetical protein
LRKLAYGLATKLAANRLVEMFDLNSGQKRELLPRLLAMHDWHRQQELPRYVALIDGLMARMGDGLDRAEVDWLMVESAAVMERLATRLAPEAGLLMAGLSDRQIDHASSEFKKGEHERFEKLEGSEEDYVAWRLKAARKNLKTWLGSYSDAQLAEFARFARKNRLEELRRRQRTVENQQVLLRAMRGHVGAEALSAIVYRWLTRQEVEPSPTFQKAEQASQEPLIELILAVDRLMTAEQRSHLLHELAAWRSDFDELHRGK